jgi:hypothetical protein
MLYQNNVIVIKSSDSSLSGIGNIKYYKYCYSDSGKL